MVTILLQQILDLLTGWLESFTTWANDMGDKVAAIKTNTDNLPGIKADTADIKDNTAAVITPIGAINSNVSAIASDVGSIKADTTVIKNNAGSIATSSGLTAAYTEDIADNTLDCKNRLVTIGSDTTQIRTDSDSIAADVTEIKNTLGLYLYNTIVTEDAEGSIANFDTDLQDYLQNAVVTIPADAGGISGLDIIKCGKNIFNKDSFYSLNGYFGGGSVQSAAFARSIFVKCNPNTKYSISKILSRFSVASFDALPEIGSTYSGIISDASKTIMDYTTGATAKYLGVYIYNSNVDTESYSDIINSIQIEEGTGSAYEAYNASDYSVLFTNPITDGAEVDLLSGIVKINTSPITYDSITPLAIRTFKGVNNIFSDIGDIDVTYRETLKHYLEKQNNNSRSLNRNVNLLRENIESTEDSDRREI